MPNTGIAIGPGAAGAPSEFGSAMGMRLAGTRHYVRTVVVGPTGNYATIGAALTAIQGMRSSDSRVRDAYAAKYRVVLQDGTYNEEVDLSATSGNTHVDLFGNRGKAIIASTSQAADTLKTGGGNALLYGLRVRHTSNVGETFQYPWHSDASSVADAAMDDGVRASCVIAWDCAFDALGGNAKSGCGFGLFSGQRIYLVDCAFHSDKLPAIYAHNWADTTKAWPAGLYVINCLAPSGGALGTGAGLQWTNLGSGKGDNLVIVGGAFRGGAATDIWLVNSTVTYTGASETILTLASGVEYSSLVTPAGQVVMEAPIVPLPPIEQPGSMVISGTRRTGTAGLVHTFDGVTRSARADNTHYLQKGDGTTVAMVMNAQMRIYGASGSFKSGANGLGVWYADDNVIQGKSNGQVGVEIGNGSGAPKLGFLGASAIARQTVSGSRGGNAAVADIITKLANVGIITDGTTA